MYEKILTLHKKVADPKVGAVMEQGDNVLDSEIERGLQNIRVTIGREET